MGENPYVLVTPARNEGPYIEQTIQSVLAQSCRPAQWVIVSDGSTDATDEIVAGYARNHEAIQLVRRSGTEARGVAAKVAAIEAGCHRITVDYHFWGNLDADVTVEPKYFESLLERFHENPKLGLAGGLVHELIRGQYRSQNVSSDSVAGAVQLFRRECYDAVGGYLPLRFGGEDAAAEVMARAAGWEVKTFPDLRVLHHRRVGGGTSGRIAAKLRQGRMDYALGYHPLFELVRCLYRIVDRPYVVGSVCRLLGYGWSALRRDRIAVPDHAADYLRAEQMQRLCNLTGRTKG